MSTLKNDGLKSNDTIADSSESRVYKTPILKHYGDVRDVTLGPTGFPPSESGSNAMDPRTKI